MYTYIYVCVYIVYIYIYIDVHRSYADDWSQVTKDSSNFQQCPAISAQFFPLPSRPSNPAPIADDKDVMQTFAVVQEASFPEL